AVSGRGHGWLGGRRLVVRLVGAAGRSWRGAGGRGAGAGGGVAGLRRVGGAVRGAWSLGRRPVAPSGLSVREIGFGSLGVRALRHVDLLALSIVLLNFGSRARSNCRNGASPRGFQATGRSDSVFGPPCGAAPGAPRQGQPARCRATSAPRARMKAGSPFGQSR